MAKVPVPMRMRFLLALLCSTVALSGCGGQNEGEETADRTAPAYPSSLSAASSPRQVAEVLLRALDEGNQDMLKGLVAAKHEAEQVDAIYRKYGKRHQTSPQKAATLTAAGWSATYAWFEAGATRVTREQIKGDSAVVEAQGRNPSTGRPRLLIINMVREDSVWKVVAGLQSREL